ncbi:MAG: histidine kinase dimerization/phospho-acceptor domain-containing protein, partial [Patescibacteria group bacterium]
MPVFTPISSLEIILGFTAFTANTYLGLMVFLKNPRSWTNRLFALLALVLDLYIVVNPPSLHPPLETPENQLFWIRMVIIVAAFIGPLLFLLIHTFPSGVITLKKEYVTLILALAGVTALASLNFHVFESITYSDGQPVAHPGKGIILFILDFPALVILSFVVLVRKLRNSKGIERLKLSYFALGVFGTFTLMVVFTTTLVVVFKTAAGIFLGPIFPVILMSTVAFAIVRHRFLDIQPIIVRAASFLIILFLFAGANALLLVLFFQIFGGLEINNQTIFVFIILTIFAMLIFQPLDKILRRLTNRIFFKDRYDRDELLSKITRTMAGTIDLDVLTTAIAGSLIKEMHLSKLAFLVAESHKIVGLRGIWNGDLAGSRQELENLFHNPFVSSAGRHIVFEDLAEGDVKEMFRRNDISVAIPMKVENNEVAILIAGSKLSGEPYFVDDLDVLGIIASESGIAVQNARAFTEIKKFSRELEQKVKERTSALKETQERELAKAREVARLKDEFVFIAAHELRTPITAIRGFLELTEPAIKGFPKYVQRHLNAIAIASSNLNQLVNDLLETARSETEAYKISVGPTDLVGIIQATIKETASLALEKKVAIEFISPKVLPEAMADQNKVKEVVTNLLSNAIKYNREGGDIAVTIFQQEQSLIVEVRDTGYGIPLEEQGK